MALMSAMADVGSGKPATPATGARAAALKSVLTVRPTGPKAATLKVTPNNTYPKTPSPRDVALSKAVGRNLQQFASRNGGAVRPGGADPRNVLTGA